MEWYYFFNEILDLKEKKKVDTSLGRGYFCQDKHVRTQTLYLTKMIKHLSSMKSTEKIKA